MTTTARPTVGEPRRTAKDGPVRLGGDAHAVFTGPFYPEGNPLEQPTIDLQAIRRQLAGSTALEETHLATETILTASLTTFQAPAFAAMVTFAASDAWLTGLRGELPPGLFDHVAVTGVLCADGYGSVACTLRATDGWAGRRAEMLAAIGPEGRDRVAAALRARLLPELALLLLAWPADVPPKPVLPYVNLIYAGGTDHPAPGRAVLDDGLRALIQPSTALPLPSQSPRLEEYLYVGYGYHLLASRDPVPTLRKLTLLLHVLNDSYARLANVAAAADDVLREEPDDGGSDLALLARTERRLRAEYQRLIAPTFSFDHHSLMLRDAILQVWDVPKLQGRADSLISMLRRAVELHMSERQAERAKRLNTIIFVLTILSVISTADAAVSLLSSL